jgi:hypothetical protein
MSVISASVDLLLEEMIALQMIMRFIVYYATHKYNTTFKARPFTLFSANWTHIKAPHSITFTSIFIKHLFYA